MARTHKSNYFPCRCRIKNKCSYRVTLTRRPDVDDKCPRCGAELIVDQYRIDQRKLPGPQRKDNPVCHCAAAAGRDGSNMPHRVGSIKECERYGVPF